jgi:ketosteroid isomerase-like protein
MNAQENKQLVMQGYRLFQSGDIPSLLELYHNDAEWSSPESDYLPFSGKFHGKSGIAEFFAKLGASAQPMRFEPVHLIAEGEQVVATGVATWLAKPTGRSYDTNWVHVFTLRDGKVARFEVFYDTAAAERAFHPDQPAEAARASLLHH